MQLSFTQKKNVRRSFGKLAETLSIPNLIEVQKNSYKQLTDFDNDAGDLTKGLVEGIICTGARLKEHFPYLKADKNELSDDISFGKN